MREGIISTLALSIAVIALFQGCQAGAGHPIVITLERTRTPEGYSPAYTVTLRSDGSVEYLGEFGVDIPGPQGGHVEPTTLDDLVKSANAIHFFGMQERYFELCTDIPTTTISIQVQRKVKRVSNEYGGCDRQSGGPQVELARLADKIDIAAGTARWIKCDSRCLADLIHTGLNLNAQSPSGETPLLAAIQKRDLAGVRVLLDADANIDRADNQGFTPLMWAVIQDQPMIAQELLQRGADASAKDARGLTASQMTGDSKLLRLLSAVEGSQKSSKSR